MSKLTDDVLNALIQRANEPPDEGADPHELPQLWYMWAPTVLEELRRLRAENERLDRERSKAIKDIQEYANLTDLDIQVALDGMP